MPEPPKLSDIPNVFGLHHPQHILTKLIVEVNALMNALSIWTKNEPYPTPLFAAYNTAVTAWHMTDWLWMASPATRQILSKKYGFEQNEITRSGLEKDSNVFRKPFAMIAVRFIFAKR